MGNDGFTMAMTSRFFKLLAGFGCHAPASKSGGFWSMSWTCLSLKFKQLSQTLDAIIALLEEDVTHIGLPT